MHRPMQFLDKLAADLGNLLKPDQPDCDVRLRAGSGESRLEIFAHMCILRSRSPYFQNQRVQRKSSLNLDIMSQCSSPKRHSMPFSERSSLKWEQISESKPLYNRSVSSTSSDVPPVAVQYTGESAGGSPSGIVAVQFTGKSEWVAVQLTDGGSIDEGSDEVSSVMSWDGDEYGWFNRRRAFDFPHMSASALKVIVEYIYTGTVELGDMTGLEVARVLEAADYLMLEELSFFVQTYLITTIESWIAHPPTVARMLRIVADGGGKFALLGDHLEKSVSEAPTAFMESDAFITLNDTALQLLLGYPNLAAIEIDIWDALIRWGLTKGIKLPSVDIADWKPENKDALRKVTERFLPLIRFHQIPAKVYLRKVRPYCALARTFEDDLYEYHIACPSEMPAEDSNKTRRDCSSLLIHGHALCIENWINGYENVPPQYSSIPLARQWTLLYRASRDGYKAADFHRLCDGKGPTVTLVRPKDSQEVLGGYNSESWEQAAKPKNGGSDGNFVFSFNANFARISRMKKPFHAYSAYRNQADMGPIWPCGLRIGGECDRQYSSRACGPELEYYTRRVTEARDFLVADYEVFQIGPLIVRRGSC